MLTTDGQISRQIFFLLCAQIRHPAGKREPPNSPMSDALFKFVEQLDIAWHAGDGVMGCVSFAPPFLRILKALSFKRPPRIMLNVKRLQGLSVLAFHPLQYISFFTSPWEPLLTELDGRLIWEGRKWLAKEEELSNMKRRKKHLVYQFTANLTRLPAILH